MNNILCNKRPNTPHNPVWLITIEPQAGQSSRECDLEERGETAAREEGRAEQQSSRLLGNDTLTSQAARRPGESYLHNRL